VATVRELKRGAWLDDTIPDDFRRDAEALCDQLSDCVADLVVSLSMFEDEYAARFLTRVPTPPSIDLEERQRDADRLYRREAELEAEHGVAWGHPEYFERRAALREQTRRTLLREEWAENGGPEAYRNRVIFIHVRSFVTTLALLQCGLVALCGYGFGPAVAAKLKQACDNFAAALPGVKDVRDSLAHGEDRARGKARSKKITPQQVPFESAAAARGMIISGLRGRHFGCTVADGAYAEVEISDATTEIARVAIQAVYDALPWRPGRRIHEPTSPTRSVTGGVGRGSVLDARGLFAGRAWGVGVGAGRACAARGCGWRVVFGQRDPVVVSRRWCGCVPAAGGVSRSPR
jgi:hypothetical protein